MKNVIFVILVCGLIGISGFKEESINYEQITFDYFISDILGSDFKDITLIEFKGKTESAYSTLGDYKFCLKPEEKLESIIKDFTKRSTQNVKPVKSEGYKSITISDFNNKTTAPRLYLYPSVHVADNFYVFLSLRKPNEQVVNYVFELQPNGNITRSCKMN